MECKLRCVNFRGVSDPRRAFLPAIRGTGISDNWYRSTMAVIVRGLGTPLGTGENFGRTWGHLGALATSLGTPRIRVEQFGKIIFFQNAAGVCGNHSYYSSFNNYSKSCMQFVFSSMYLYSYPSSHGISGLTAGVALKAI